MSAEVVVMDQFSDIILVQFLTSLWLWLQQFLSVWLGFVKKMGHSAVVWDSKLALETTKDWNGIEQIMLRNPQDGSARVSLHGGQVISWRNERGEELLFTSSKGILKPPKAMRGGIPICFPQFGNCDSLEQHGFARNKIWAVDDDPPPLPSNDSHGKSFVDLLLKPSEEDLKFWPHSFEFRLRVTLGMDGNLSLISRIRNVNGKPFSFSFAYQTYLSISDISAVRVEGLETMDYFDNLCKRERFTEQGDAITFESEIDRIYLSSPNCIVVLDHERKRTYVLRKEGLPDVGLGLLQLKIDYKTQMVPGSGLCIFGINCNKRNPQRPCGPAATRGFLLVILTLQKAKKLYE